MVAGVAAAAIGYFGAAVALGLSTIVFPPAATKDVPFLLEALVALALAVTLSVPLIPALFLAARLADRLLERLGWCSAPAYAAAGALIGAVAGALLIGWLFKQPVRGAACCVPVGALAGLAYWTIARPPT